MWVQAVQGLWQFYSDIRESGFLYVFLLSLKGGFALQFARWLFAPQTSQLFKSKTIVFLQSLLIALQFHLTGHNWVTSPTQDAGDSGKFVFKHITTLFKIDTLLIRKSEQATSSVGRWYASHASLFLNTALRVRWCHVCCRREMGAQRG